MRAEAIEKRNGEDQMVRVSGLARGGFLAVLEIV